MIFLILYTIILNLPKSYKNGTESSPASLTVTSCFITTAHSSKVRNWHWTALLATAFNRISPVFPLMSLLGSRIPLKFPHCFPSLCLRLFSVFDLFLSLSLFVSYDVGFWRTLVRCAVGWPWGFVPGFSWLDQGCGWERGSAEGGEEYHGAEVGFSLRAFWGCMIAMCLVTGDINLT